MHVLVPLPSTDFDPTETAVPWKLLTNAGMRVTFATPDGAPGAADSRMVEGTDLGPWKPILRAAPIARELYAEMVASDEFRGPTPWANLGSGDFEALLLPGGHAQGMREYLESTVLQRIVADFMTRNDPVGAICHGLVLLARSRAEDGTSVLSGRRVTSLLQSQELAAWAMTKLWLGDYYRTYPQTVEAEVREALGPDGTFEAGPPAVLRDDPEHLGRGFFVEDGNLLTARWPGDAFAFANRFVAKLTG